ncbi:outer membrane usher protein [Sphingopyxis sp. YR583]|uniref:fimbria/pilus outer membrane usher protein n=1 Tax=Sphingopyxis sp. YR583 TaxID=1881047 RepID=UPI0008A7C983|nr:fimbria/pilus outer membrane usher protein [Sphingopyxis sp. YR583]SEH12512.1 outer membrane usher protein [Sphingopyxis sp. YR583]
MANHRAIYSLGGILGALAIMVPVSASCASEGLASFGDLPPPPRSVASGADQQLLLELIVNERRSGIVAPVQLAGSRFRVELADLRKAGLQVGAQTASVYIDELPGMAAAYDVPSQQLRLTAAPDYFPVQRVGKARRTFEPASYDMGALLNYDVYVSGGGDRKPQASLWHEARMFSGAGVVSTTGVLRSGGKAYVRYDTSWRRSDEATAVTLEAGDLVTRTLPWASAVRLGGIQVSRDFAVRPDIITYPLPAFAGRAALPSTVDLIVSGQRVGGAAVNPGPFAIENLPPITGAGEANLVVTDMHGRSISTSMPFYVSSALLHPGLTDFALAMGAFRENYGVRNFDYGGVAGSASLRHGLSDAVTLEVRAEIADDMQLAGGGAVVRLGAGGVVSGSYSRSFRSETDGGNGEQWTVGYEYQARRFSVALRHSRESAGYVDLGLIETIRAHATRDISSATLSLSLGPGGTVGLGYFAIREDNGRNTRIGNASFSLPVWRGSRINASASHEFEDQSWSGALTLSVPLGGNRGTVAAGLTDLPGGGAGWRADYSRAIPSDGGWGWSASAAGQRGDLALRGDVAWRTDPVLLRAGAYGSGDATWWAGASGSLVFMDDSVFAANRVPDAFVIVSTGGEAGIPVRYENQLVGRTNADGKLLIPWGTAYYPGQYEIDTLDFDADVAAPLVSQRVAVARGSGHIVRFPVTRMRAARLVVRDADGSVLPAGTSVRIGASAAIIGWDGLLFIENLDEGAIAEIEIAGRHCRLDLALPAKSSDAGSIIDLGERTCALH